MIDTLSVSVYGSDAFGGEHIKCIPPQVPNSFASSVERTALQASLHVSPVKPSQAEHGFVRFSTHVSVACEGKERCVL
jgi:hypothetical protein